MTCECDYFYLVTMYYGEQDPQVYIIRYAEVLQRMRYEKMHHLIVRVTAANDVSWEMFSSLSNPGM